MFNEDLIKALRCVGSVTYLGDCYRDIFNDRTESGKEMYCKKDPTDGLACPYYQETYGVCYDGGELSWLSKLADELEEERGKNS